MCVSKRSNRNILDWKFNLPASSTEQGRGPRRAADSLREEEFNNLKNGDRKLPCVFAV